MRCTELPTPQVNELTMNQLFRKHNSPLNERSVQYKDVTSLFFVCVCADNFTDCMVSSHKDQKRFSKSVLGKSWWLADRGFQTSLQRLLCGRMRQRASLYQRVCMNKCARVCVCIQVDNGCFCSLYRLVFQDSVLSPRLPQVGSTQHQTHSVPCFTLLPPLVLWIIFWSDLEHVVF